MTRLIKAQAYGNDFLMLVASDARAIDGPEYAHLARRACDRHHGIGADGFIVVRPTAAGAETRLFNQDGSRAEVSGNGVRCVAAWLAHEGRHSVGTHLAIGTAAGEKTLTLLAIDAAQGEQRYRFRADMGRPRDVARRHLRLGAEAADVVTLSIGNPHCVVPGPLTDERFQKLGRLLSVHPDFPEGTNVELASLESQDRLRILIWERGVGPTSSSGTGSCAAAIAAIAVFGAARRLDVTAPGGTQQVEWREGPDERVWLDGEAELVASVDWLVEGAAPPAA